MQDYIIGAWTDLVELHDNVDTGKVTEATLSDAIERVRAKLVRSIGHLELILACMPTLARQWRKELAPVEKPSPVDVNTHV